MPGGPTAARRYRDGVFTRPDDLTDAVIVRCLADGWSVKVSTVEWVPVGFGSHHWQALGDEERWFVSVDDLDARKRDESETRDGAAVRLAAALGVARSLRDAGLGFVVAPLATQAGDIVHPIDDRYVAALYDYVDGEFHLWGAYPTRTDRLAVLDRIVAVHTTPTNRAPMAIRDDLAIPGRDGLDLLLAGDDSPWGPGPYAEPARALLHDHGDALGRVLARYDDLVSEVTRYPERMVITHGEPHRANTINTVDGVALIDWDTALLAPPERDLWALIDEDAQIEAFYTERTGVVLDDAAMRLYRLWWDLCEISLFTAEFRARHTDTEDTRVAWAALERFLDPARWSQLF